MKNRRRHSPGGVLILGLILFSAAAGAALADRATALGVFALRNAAEAAQVWKAGPGAPTASYEPAPPAGVKLPCLFGGATDRLYWDRAATLDLRGYDALELDLTCAQPNALRTFGLYLKSGGGWYLWLVPLTEPGRQKLMFPIRDAAVEGKPAGWNAIDAVRISVTRAELGAPGLERTAAIIAHGFQARACSLAVIQATLSLARSEDKAYARSAALRLSGWLRDQGIAHSVLDDDAVADGRLQAVQVAILPYNSRPPNKELRALQSFVKRGGKLMVFYSAEPRLAGLMGLKLGRYQASRVAGRWSSFAFNRHAPPHAPEVIYQDSFNILPAYPADKDSRIIALWRNGGGEELADPAWVQSPSGFWMSHVLLDGDAAGKQRMLLAMLGAYLPSVWEQAAARAMARAGKVGPFANLAEAAAGIAGMAQGTPESQAVNNLLAQCERDYRAMSAALARQKHPEVVSSGRQLQAALLQAFARVQRPRPSEFRGVWDHTGLGLYPGNWPKTAQILAAAGMRAVFVNVLWAGLAHYDSRVVPPSANFGHYGDQLQQCLAAARANRLEVHAWKVCWNLGNAPESFVAAMRKAGRLQVGADGKELKWLCPSHPENLALELQAVSEAAGRYQVDGIHLDYVRYPNNNACFCDGCRRRFGQELGEKISGWPRSAQYGDLRARYNAWRCEQITAFVRAARGITRRAGIKLSVAVYPEYPGCAASIGQDWGRWLKEGLVDFVCPMNYTANNDVFKGRLRKQLALPGAGRRVFPGLGVTASESKLTPDQVIEQIRMARDAGAGGFVLFDLNRTVEKDVLPILSRGITRAVSGGQ